MWWTQWLHIEEDGHKAPVLVTDIWSRWVRKKANKQELNRWQPVCTRSVEEQGSKPWSTTPDRGYHQATCAGYIMQQEVDKSTQNSQWGVTEVYMGMPVGLCKSIDPGGTELQKVRVKNWEQCICRSSKAVNGAGAYGALKVSKHKLVQLKCITNINTGEVVSNNITFP